MGAFVWLTGLPRLARHDSGILGEVISSYQPQVQIGESSAWFPCRSDDRRILASISHHDIPVAPRPSPARNGSRGHRHLERESVPSHLYSLSPLHIHVVGDPKMALEQFWQERK